MLSEAMPGQVSCRTSPRLPRRLLQHAQSCCPGQTFNITGSCVTCFLPSERSLSTSPGGRSTLRRSRLFGRSGKRLVQHPATHACTGDCSGWARVEHHVRHLFYNCTCIHLLRCARSVAQCWYVAAFVAAKHVFPQLRRLDTPATCTPAQLRLRRRLCMLGTAGIPLVASAPWWLRLLFKPLPAAQVNEAVPGSMTSDIALMPCSISCCVTAAVHGLVHGSSE
jgi:hypothetical protein